MIQVVKRVSEILSAVHAAGELPLREIAVRTGLRKTTAGNLVRSLLAVGLLDQRTNGRYAIGQAVRRLGWKGVSPLRLAELAAASVARLSDRLGEGVVAVKLAAAGLEVLAESTPDHAVVVNPRVLREVSPFAWASGRALLAAQPEAAWPTLPVHYGQPDSEWPEAAGGALTAELLRIRTQGWAQRHCRRNAVHSLARAVPDPFGGGLLALGVYIPAGRWERGRNAVVLEALAQETAGLAATVAAEHASA